MPNVSQRKTNFPQLGGEMQLRHVHARSTGEPKYSEAGNPELAASFGHVDLGHQANQRAAMATYTHSILSAYKHHPETAEFGEQWFPRVHEATMKSIRGPGSRGFLSSHGADRGLAAAGLVAAVSPNMDWDRNNIAAMSELRGLGQHHWDAIMASQGGDSRSARRSQARAQEAVSGLSIASAPIANLQKAGRIVRGEHPEEVLNPRTAPKTFNFMHNIHDPSHPGYVTIDGRAFDTLTNRLRTWDANRGISSSNLQRGTSRYEHARNIVQAIAGGLDMHPSAAQAVSWSHTKYDIERLGGSREQGPQRVGQPYFHPETGAPAAFSEAHMAHYRNLSRQFQ
jgi:hypothetical protein